METQTTTVRQIKEQASQWLVHLSSDDATMDDRIRFAEWLAASPDHEAAYNRIERVSDCISSTQELVADNVDAAFAAILRSQGKVSTLPTRGNRWKLLPIAAMAATLLLGVFAVMTVINKVNTPQQYTTEVAQTQEVSLDDGSNVTLGAHSRISVEFSETQRRVTLISGEAFFEVSKDANRPFVVAVGDTQAQVVGTQFNVHRGQQETQVAVLQGVVKIIHGPATGPASSAILTAGKKITATKGGPLSPVKDISLDEPGAWRSGRLIFEDAKLLEVIADANRYYGGQIVIASEDISDLRITAAFNTGQIKEMIYNLTLGLPIDAVEQDGRIILKAARQ